MLKRLYHRILTLSASPAANLWLALVAFAEASFFPFPPDALLIPIILARPRMAWRAAAICTVASVVGGAFGYLIGDFFFAKLALPLMQAYGYGPTFAQFQQRFAEYGLWVILIKGLTPIPYKIVTIASGAAHFNFGVFILASLATRGLRFFVLAALLYWFGDSVRVFVERYLTLVTTAVVLVCLGGFLLLRVI